jgi:cell division protein FtsW (lipid II flippase)
MVSHPISSIGIGSGGGSGMTMPSAKAGVVIANSKTPTAMAVTNRETGDFVFFISLLLMYWLVYLLDAP